MKEFDVENGKKVDWKELIVPWIEEGAYKQINQLTIKACHDVLIKHQGGFLLVIRNQFPAKGIYWPIGGGIKRGMPIEESLRKLVFEECSLQLESVKNLGVARTIFASDPFGHGYGVDSLNVMFFAVAKPDQTLSLNADHSNPLILTPEQFQLQKDKFHPYVQEIINLSLPHF